MRGSARHKESHHLWQCENSCCAWQRPLFLWPCHVSSKPLTILRGLYRFQRALLPQLAKLQLTQAFVFSVLQYCYPAYENSVSRGHKKWGIEKLQNAVVALPSIWCLVIMSNEALHHLYRRLKSAFYGRRMQDDDILPSPQCSMSQRAAVRHG